MASTEEVSTIFACPSSKITAFSPAAPNVIGLPWTRSIRLIARSSLPVSWMKALSLKTLQF